MRPLAPYPVLAGEVRMDIMSVSLDGRALPLAMISQGDRVVALHQAERRDWEEARFDVRVELPEREIPLHAWPDVVCAASLEEGATNFRSVTPLRASSSPAVRTGTVVLARDRHRDRARLSAVVVAEVDGVPGRVVGESDADWIVDLVAARPTRQRELDIERVDFRDGGLEWLRPFRDAPWMVETSGDMPTVYVNTGFEGVAELLDARSGKMRRAVRDMLAGQIAGEAWTAMFHSAIGDLEVDEEGVPQWPGGWRGDVLRAMLPEILPGLSPHDALSEIISRRADGVGPHELQPRVQYAADRRARVARHLLTAVRTLDRPEEV
ncbi:hypothetical protein ACL02R_14400 [Streptomyces sp. MS19]|uniref:hypothetical protein n=1 Tax=Streptomyces sp. MS19 TaxID=3385972 RepID=UPI0039A21AC8